MHSANPHYVSYTLCWPLINPSVSVLYIFARFLSKTTIPVVNLLLRKKEKSDANHFLFFSIAKALWKCYNISHILTIFLNRFRFQSDFCDKCVNVYMFCIWIYISVKGLTPPFVFYISMGFAYQNSRLHNCNANMECTTFQSCVKTATHRITARYDEFKREHIANNNFFSLHFLLLLIYHIDSNTSVSRSSILLCYLYQQPNDTKYASRATDKTKKKEKKLLN